MSYVRLPPLGFDFSAKLNATISNVSASASTSAKTAAPPLVYGMDPATLAAAEKRCGKAPATSGLFGDQSKFNAWAKCVMTNGTGGSAPAANPPAAPTSGPGCYVASKNATLADVRRGCAVLKRGQASGDGGQPTLFWRQFLGLPAGTVFDAQLEDATKAFQAHMKLPVTGQLNKETLAYTLSQPIKEGSDNDDVWALHRLLGLPSEGATGAYRYKFTKYTTGRLSAYQGAMMLPVTGVVDDATRSALLAQGVTPAMVSAAKEANAAAKAKAAAAKPASEGGPSSSSASSGGTSGSTGMLIMVGLVGLAAYFVWASPKVKRKSA